jgi:hypothetical protein
LFLTAADLIALTGYQRPSAQVRWLKRHGWRFTVNALGQPVIAVAEFNRRMVGGRSVAQEPDWGALNGPQANAG